MFGGSNKHELRGYNKAHMMVGYKHAQGGNSNVIVACA